MDPAGCLLGGLLLLGPVQVAAPHPDPGSLPDIVVVVADDLHWQDLEATYTPSIDRLAQVGVTLTGHHSMPLCSPSRAALLYGRWPRRSGIGTGVDHQGHVEPKPASELVSLPLLLKARGYRSCLVGKWHLGPADWTGDAAAVGSLGESYGPHSAGFDRWLAGSPGNVSLPNGYFDWLRVDDGIVQREFAYATRVMVEEACRWLGSTGGPRYLQVCLQSPHQPFHSPPPELVPGYPGPPMTPTQKFLQMVGTVDWAVGRLLSAVTRDTLFVFVSDNGTPANVNGSGAVAKGTTLRRGVQVPLILVGPRLVPGRRDDLISLVDLPATLYELATGELPRVEKGMGFEDAISFAPLLVPGLRPGAPRRTWLMSEKFDGFGDDLMVRTDRWKLRHFLRGPAAVGGASRHDLYDLSVDPFELAPIAIAGPLDGEQVAALAELEALARSLPVRAGP